MKKIVIVVILAGMVGWAIFDFIGSRPSNEKNQEVGLEIGNVAPDFELQTLSGENVRLSDYRGKKVMLNFWATWCPPCRAEMPDMQKFYEDTDMEILGVNLTSSEVNIGSVENFVDEMGISFPILLDGKNKVGTTYYIQPIPTSFMIDKNGVIQYKTFGPMNYEMMMNEFNKMD